MIKIRKKEGRKEGKKDGIKEEKENWPGKSPKSQSHCLSCLSLIYLLYPKLAVQPHLSETAPIATRP
jgi:hypothetical protein